MSIDYNNNPFPGLVQDDQTCWRFTDKSNQDSERLLFDNWWRELINQFGVKTTYYVNTFNTLSADNLYGEQPTKKFAPPVEFVMGINLNDNAITLSQFGFLSDDEVTGFIHIQAFESAFSSLTAEGLWETQNNIIEPKAGDIFQLSEFGSDRPSNRQPKYFEITEKLDEDIAQINPLAGHYVFLVKAKRYDYSFEPGITFTSIGPEYLTTHGGAGLLAGDDPLFVGDHPDDATLSVGISGNDQIYEDSFAGRLSGGANPESLPKQENYDEYDADSFSKNEVFDMSENDTDVYGEYY
jgi:hypothetical protein